MKTSSTDRIMKSPTSVLLEAGYVVLSLILKFEDGAALILVVLTTVFLASSGNMKSKIFYMMVICNNLENIMGSFIMDTCLKRDKQNHAFCYSNKKYLTFSYLNQRNKMQ